MEKLERIEKITTDLVKEMKQMQKLPEWLYKTSENNSKFEKIKLGWHILWDASKVSAIFKNEISFPEEIFGINLIGTKVEGMFFTPLGGEIFVNGEKVAESEYWLPEIIFPITENLKSDEKFLIEIRTKKSDGWGTTFFSRVYIESLEEVIFQMELISNLISFTKAISKWEKNLKGISQKILKDMESCIDLKMLEEKKLKQILPSLETAIKLFDRLYPFSKKYTIHLIGHAHIDMNWLWEWKSTLYTAKGTFTTVDKLMQKYPEFKFSQSQAALYKAVEEKFPDVFSLIKKRVSERKWEITASTWVEGDLNMASGESLVRQILYAKKYIREKFGKDVKICWAADTFGHPWTYPQILKKSGIDFYYAHRCPPEKEYPVFWWKGPDSSKVLALVTGETYNSRVTPSLCRGLINWKNRCGSNHYFVSHGVGNHGGGPTLKDIERTLKLQKIKGFPKIKFDFAENYFKEVLKEKIKLPEVKNELNPTFEGCYTTHSDIKFFNRTLETHLFTAEVLSSINSLLEINEYPFSQLEKAWENTCFNQFHDILCGSGIHQIYQEGEGHAKTVFNEAFSLIEQIINNSLKELSRNISYKREGIPIMIFNPLPWEREDAVVINNENFSEKEFFKYSLYDDRGNIVPFQFNGNRMSFIAKVPATGYRVYYLAEGKNISSEEIYVYEDNNNIHIENRFYKIIIEKNSGCLRKLFLKETEKEIILQPANLFQIFYEKPHDMSAWNIGPISKIENILTGAETVLFEKGPVKAVVRVKHRILNSDLLQDIVVYRDIPRIDFFTNINWKETGSDKKDAPMLKVCFPLSITAKEGCFEIPFGHIYRPANGSEYVQLKWMDLSDKKFGVSIFNNAKYGCSILANTMILTLIRSAYEPDPVSGLGKHRFSYSLYPHKHNWKKAKTLCKAVEFNIPLIGWFVSEKSKRGSLPERFSFLSLTPLNVIISAIKKAEDKNGIIIRFYEGYGKDTEVVINLNIPFKNAFEVDLLEEKKEKKIKIYKNKIKIPLKKFEIKTIKLEK